MFILLTAQLSLSSCGFIKKIHTREEVCIDPLSNKDYSKINSLETGHPNIIESKQVSALQNKYCKILHVDVKKLPDSRLLAFADEWFGVPYKYGGHDKHGIDCSGFAARLYQEVYGINISGSSGQLQQTCSGIKHNELKEGDLLFFKIHRGRISHVGVYLANDYFIHASTKAGVIISHLSEDYYKRYYSCAGRPKNNL
jgi:lipoprotein Spr